MRYYTHSEISVFQDCRRRWWLGTYRRLQPRFRKVTGAAPIGTRIHSALGPYYVPDNMGPVDPRETLEKVIAEDREALIANAELQPQDVAVGWMDEAQDFTVELAEFEKEADLCRAMIQGYMEWLAETGADSDFEVVLPSEQAVEYEFAPGESLLGRLDAQVVQISTGAHLGVDHKPQPLSALVLTPIGWVRMGDLKVDDKIINHRGDIETVQEVFDRGLDDVFTITFNDGTTARATQEHIWALHDHSVVATYDLRLGSKLLQYQPNPNYGGCGPIDGYILGMWLANGQRNRFTACDGEAGTMSEFAARLGVDVQTSQRDGRKKLFTVDFHKHDAAQVLTKMDLYDKSSCGRFIPPSYLYETDVNTRLDLLRGLMDGDGYFRLNGGCLYTTTSPQLAQDVAELVRSLGGWSKIWTNGRPSRVGSNEHGYDTTTQGYIVTVRTPFNPFFRCWHAERWASHRAAHQMLPTAKIVRSVKLTSREETRCIRISGQHHLYVTDGHAVTHNTGDFAALRSTLRDSDQMLRYEILRRTRMPEARSNGMLFNMLRKVKRTAKATPPFYDRLTVNFNQAQLESAWTRTMGVINDIRLVEARLNAGADHRLVAYSRRTKDCDWKCEFRAVCPTFDDGSRAEDMVQSLFVTGDPLERYPELTGGSE